MKAFKTLAFILALATFQAVANDIGLEVLSSVSSRAMARFPDNASRERFAARLEASNEDTSNKLISDELISDEVGQKLHEKRDLGMINSGTEQEKLLNRYLTQIQQPNPGVL